MALSDAQRSDINRMFNDEIASLITTVDRQFHEMLDQARVDVRERLIDEGKLVDNSARVAQLTKEVERMREEMTKLHNDMAKADAERAELQRKLMGDWSGPPTVEQYLKLGMEPTSVYKNHHPREWHGIALHTKLDAEVCIELSKNVDMVKSSRLVHDIGASVRRELRFISNLKEAKELYAKFYGLGLRKLGVPIAPMLEELTEEVTKPQLKALKGSKKAKK